MRENVRELSDADFAASVRDGVALVDFYGTYCPPCKLLEPVIENIAGRYAGRVSVAALNVDDNFESAADNSIEDIPTIVLFRNGVEAKRLFGLQAEETVAAELDKILGAARA